MASIYLDGDYLANHPTWHSEDSAIKARWIDAILRRNSQSPARVVEVGCGAGGVISELQKLRPDADYVGYEISPDAFQLSRAHANDRLIYRNADILEADEAGFDALLLIDVFEHVPDYMGFLRSLRDRAGIKIFHIPLDLSAQAVARGTPYRHLRSVVGHLHYFHKESALATLVDCGYSIVDHMYTCGSQEMPNRPLKTKLLNVVRKLFEMVSRDASARLLGGYSLMVLAR